LAVKKRKQALEENKINRENARAAALPDQDSDVLDTLLEKLRNGDTVGRRARRARPSAEPRSIVPLSLTLNESVPLGDNTADRARDMLARLQSNGDVLAGLQSDGFVVPPSPTVAASQRRRRRRTENTSGDMPGSPLAAEIYEIQEAEETMDTTH
jgi:cytokinesis protein